MWGSLSLQCLLAIQIERPNKSGVCGLGQAGDIYLGATGIQMRIKVKNMDEII